MTDILHIDGAYGEGGGQILRTSVALASITGKALRIDHIRARRRRAGLMRQHLTAVTAAATLCRGELRGAELGSTTVELRPGRPRAGEYHFAVGTAGSACLVLQTVLPILLTCEGRSRVTVEGGTHNKMAPPYDFLAHTFVPVLRRMGANVSLELVRHGFYPAGGGKIVAEVEPTTLRPLALNERGALLRQRARILIAALPHAIAQREVEYLRKKLGWAEHPITVEAIEDTAGPGNVMMVEVQSENITEVFTGFGERGVRVADVASPMLRELRAYQASDAPVGIHLADQLLLPLALGRGGEFRTVGITLHTQTNAHVIQKFLPVEITFSPTARGDTIVRVTGPNM